jgi:hypothetical protein
MRQARIAGAENPVGRHIHIELGRERSDEIYFAEDAEPTLRKHRLRSCHRVIKTRLKPFEK